MGKVKESRTLMGRFIFFLLMAMLFSACGGGSAESLQTPVPEATDIPIANETLTEEAGVSTETVTPTDGPSSSGTGVSFANDVLPIFNSRCSQCHGGATPRGGLSLSSYTSLMAGSNNGPVIIPGDADNSVLIQLVKAGTMPKVGADLFPEQIQTLIDWVNAGALDN